MKEFFKLNRTIQLRIMMNFIGALCFSTIGSSMTIYYNQYMGANVTGVLLIISSIVSFLTGIWAGHLSDMRGRRPIMLFSTLITTVGGGMATFANSSFYFNPWLTYIGFLTLFFGYGFFNTASSAMLVDLTTTDNRKFVYSIQYWVFNLAILFGSALSGWFFRDYLVWLLLAITLEELLSFLIVLFFIPESFDPTTAEHKKKSEKNILKSYFAVLKDRAFLYYCFASIFISMIFGQIDYYLPVHLSDSFLATRFFGMQIYGQRMLTIFLIVNTTLIVLFMQGMNKLTENWSRKTGVTIGVILQGSGFIIAFLGSDFTWEIAASIVATVGEMILVPFSQALRADLMEGDRVGVYTGAWSITQPLSAVISGMLVSFSAFIGNVGMAFVMVLIIFGAILPARKSIRLHEAPKVL